MRNFIFYVIKKYTHTYTHTYSHTHYTQRFIIIIDKDWPIEHIRMFVAIWIKMIYKLKLINTYLKFVMISQSFITIFRSKDYL